MAWKGAAGKPGRGRQGQNRLSRPSHGLMWLQHGRVGGVGLWKQPGNAVGFLRRMRHCPEASEPKRAARADVGG